MLESIIDIQNGSKVYGKKVILQNINVSINSGKCISIMGINGSGKSTLLRMIAGLCYLSEGKRTVNWNYSNLKIGYVPEHFPSSQMTPNQYLFHMGKIQGLDDTKICDGISNNSTLLKLSGFLDTPIYKLSKGTVQKVSIIQAMLDMPDILLLDEPIEGIDEESAEQLINLLLKLKNDNVPIIIACHEKYIADKIGDTTYAISENTLKEINKNVEEVSMEVVCILPHKMDLTIFEKFKVDAKIVFEGNIVKVLLKKDKCNKYIQILIENECSICSVNPTNRRHNS